MTKTAPYLLWIPWVFTVLFFFPRSEPKPQVFVYYGPAAFVQRVNDTLQKPDISLQHSIKKQPRLMRPQSRCGTDFSILQEPCSPTAVVFIIGDSANTQTNWETGDGTVYTNQYSPAHTYADTGTYAVKLILDKNGCKDTLERVLHAGFEAENILLTPDSTICSGTDALLRSRIDTGFGFCWTPQNTLNNPLSDTPRTQGGSSTRYRLKGIVPKQNLLQNGDFSQGNSQFQSDYTLSTGSPSISNTGQYVIYDSTVYAVPGAASCGNFQDGFGNRLIVRNNTSDAARIWSSTVSILPNTRYVFSCRIQPVLNPAEARLQFAINDAPVGKWMDVSPTPCSWTTNNVIWISGPDTPVTLSIINRSTAGEACFAIDDIRFSEFVLANDSVSITVDTPVIKTINDTSTCRGTQVLLNTSGGVRYQWTPATALSDSNSASPLASPSDTLKYFVTGITAAGCRTTDSVQINILPSPLITKSADTSICIGDSAYLRVSGAQAYAWTPVASLSASDVAEPVAGPSVNTTYYVISTDPALTCTATDSIRVSLRVAANFSLSAAADSVCSGSPVQLTASGGSSYRWQPAGLLNDPFSASPVARPLNTTVFFVRIVDSACNDTAVLNRRIVAKPLPRLIITKSNDIDCFDLNARLSVSGADTVRWFAAQQPLYLTDSSIFNPIAFPSTTKKYYVTGTDTLSGCTRIDSIMVYNYIKGNPPFIAPNSFTPNGDGLNDCWKAIPDGRLLYFEVAIYNRWGNRVYFSRNPDECWNGTFKGAPQDPGNYVYYIKASNTCKSDVSSGNLLLLR